MHHSHGVDPTNQDPHWVSALAAHRNTDLLLTGSRDGWLRVWQVGEGFRSLTELNKIAVLGLTNSLSISECGGWAAGQWLGWARNTDSAVGARIKQPKTTSQ